MSEYIPHIGPLEPKPKASSELLAALESLSHVKVGSFKEPELAYVHKTELEALRAVASAAQRCEREGYHATATQELERAVRALAALGAKV